MFSRPVAAALLGLDWRAFDRLGVPPVPMAGLQPRYSRQAVEEILGRPITPDDLAAAEADLCPRRGRASVEDRPQKAQPHV